MSDGPGEAVARKDKGQWKLIPSASDVDAELKEGHLLSSRVKDAGLAISMVKEKAKSTSSIVKYGIETIDYLANPLVTGVLNTIDKRVLGTVDPVLSFVYNNAVKIGNEAVGAGGGGDNGEGALKAQWFNKVDNLLNPSSMPVERIVANFQTATMLEWKKELKPVNEAKEDLAVYTSEQFKEGAKMQMDDAAWEEKLDAKAFNDATKDEIKKRYQKVKSAMKALTTKQSKAFVNGVKKRMGKAWDPRFQSYAAAFFSAAKEHYNAMDVKVDEVVTAEDVTKALQPAWEARVIRIFHSRILQNVDAYKSLLKAYINGSLEDEDAKETEYDVRLAPYVAEFLQDAKARQPADLQKVVDALDVYEDDSKICLRGLLMYVTALVKRYVEKPYKKVLKSTLKAADYIIPPGNGVKTITDGSAADEEKTKESKSHSYEGEDADVSLTTVTRTVTTRIATKGMTSISYGVEVLLGPRIIPYAQNLLRNVHDKQVAPTLSLLETRINALNEFIHKRAIDPIAQPVKAVATGVLESKRARVLKARLSRAIEFAQGVAIEGTDYVLERDLVLLPVDIGKFFAITVGIAEKDDDYGLVVDHVSGLLSAILDVVKVVGWRETKTKKPEALEEEARS